MRLIEKITKIFDHYKRANILRGQSKYKNGYNCQTMRDQNIKKAITPDI